MKILLIPEQQNSLQWAFLWKDNFIQLMRLSTLLFLFLFMASCGKDGSLQAWQEISNADGYEVYDLHYDESQNVLVGVGGKPWDLGTIHISYDLGDTWKVDSIADFCLTACEQLGNKEWVAVGLYGTLVRLTEDFKTSELIRNRVHNLSDVSSYEDKVVVVGYENFQEGIIQIYDSQFTGMKDTIINQGLFACHLNSYFYYVGGFGIAVSKAIEDSEFKLIDEIAGEQITDIFQDSDLLYLLGHGGKIFIQNIENLNWSEHRITSNFIRNPGLKKGISIPSTNIIMAVGDRGNAYISYDKGNKWTTKNVPEEDYISLTYAKPYIFAGTKSGKIYRINENEL